MMDDVNDYSEPIEEVFKEYFDPDNYFTWIAFNILVSNTDTQSQNYLLYSPLQSNKWYFINWDCDGSFFRYSDNQLDPSQMGFEYGVSDYWGNVLFNRVMRVPQYRKMLDDKIEALMKILTPQRIYNLTKSYRSVMEQYLFQMPDMLHIHLTQQQYDGECDKLSQEIQLNYNLYKLSLKTPMPFFADPPVVSNGSANFSWQVSYDFDGEDITYTFELSQDCTFRQTISKQENLLLPTASVGNLSPGKYFFRVTAVKADGYTQTLFGKYEWNNVKYYGVQCFYILPDGVVKMDENNS